MPDVTHKRLAAAKTAIQHHGCTVGKITDAASSIIAAGRVILQQPPAGAKKRTWSRVTHVVSSGKPVT